MTANVQHSTNYIRLWSFVLAMLLMIGVAILIPREGLWSNRPFHENITIISAVASFFAGTLSLVRYYAKKVCPFLWIGIAFLGNAVIELVYVNVYSFYPVFNADMPFATFMIWGWWLGRVYLSCTLACAYVTCRKLEPGVRYNRQETGAYLVGAVLLVSCLLALFYLALPTTRVTGTINRPLEFVPAALFLISLIGFYRQNQWTKSLFAYWFVLSLVICVAVQLFIAPFSSQIYDPNFMAGNVFRATAHVLVVVGLNCEIYNSYKQAEERADRIAAQNLMVSQVKDYALYLLDPKGYVMTWNTGAELLKGYKENEIIGKHFSIFYTKADLDEHKPEIEMRDAKENGHFEDEGWRVRKDGSRFWANVIVTPIYNTNNEFIGFSKITRDLTERKRIEDELKKQNVLLGQSNEQLEQYAYIATHDLKEPLRSIASFTELMLRKLELKPEGISIYAEYIRKAVDRTKSLIEGLRTYSKVGNEANEPLTLVDMNQPFEDAMTLLRKRIEETNTVITASRLPKILGISSQLMYLFLHLLDNAIKYVKPGILPRIEVRCSEAGNTYLITVADNGVGIPGEYRDKVFTLFQKLHRDDQSGTGIGLAICKKVVALHGGDIGYTTDESGTTFRISFPMP